MPNPMIRIHDIESGEVIDREMTAEEFAEYKIEVKAVDEIRVERESKAAAKAAIAERLGLSDAELALLLG